MTYLECLSRMQAASTPLEMSRVALQYYAEIPQHPHRIVFDKGSVAKEALRKLPGDETAATTPGRGNDE